jgi:FkbM family methyltransferase
MSIRPLLRKYLRTYPEWGFHLPRVERTRQLTRIGSDYGGYFLDISILPQDPVIYSAGIGLDISFDLALIRRHDCTVHAFDPTPRVQEWLEGQSLSPQFRFHPVGIADFDGSADFFLPPRPDFLSHSMVESRQYSADSIRVPVMKLSSVMRELGHNRIDVLKMDIEGAEYAVMSDLIRDRIEIGQILVEFHHRLSSIGVKSTRRMLHEFDDYGMDVCHVSPRADVFTLISRSLPE